MTAEAVVVASGHNQRAPAARPAATPASSPPSSCTATTTADPSSCRAGGCSSSAAATRPWTSPSTPPTPPRGPCCRCAAASWVVPKYLFGRPSGHAQRRPRQRLPWRLRQRISQTMLRLAVGPPARYGLPTPGTASCRTTPRSPTRCCPGITHGEIEVRPGIAAFDGDRRRSSTDGRSRPSRPRRLVHRLPHRPRLPRPGAARRRRRPAAAVPARVPPRRARAEFVGLMQSTGAALPLVEAQARLRRRAPGRPVRAADRPRSGPAPPNCARPRPGGGDRRPAMRIDFDAYLELAGTRELAGRHGSGRRHERPDGRRVVVTGAQRHLRTVARAAARPPRARPSSASTCVAVDGPVPVLACDLTSAAAPGSSPPPSSSSAASTCSINNAGVGGPAPAELPPTRSSPGSWRSTSWPPGGRPPRPCRRSRRPAAGSCSSPAGWRSCRCPSPPPTVQQAGPRRLRRRAAPRGRQPRRGERRVPEHGRLPDPRHDRRGRPVAAGRVKPRAGRAVSSPRSCARPPPARHPARVATTRRGRFEMAVARHFPSLADAMVRRAVASRLTPAPSTPHPSPRAWSAGTARTTRRRRVMIGWGPPPTSPPPRTDAPPGLSSPTRSCGSSRTARSSPQRWTCCAASAAGAAAAMVPSSCRAWAEGLAGSAW